MRIGKRQHLRPWRLDLPHSLRKHRRMFYLRLAHSTKIIISFLQDILYSATLVQNVLYDDELIVMLSGKHRSLRDTHKHHCNSNL